mmetsp:Transcript_25276/g.31086  ORF Transcript_25276/g.31086 Transcript_25276/m.31086 type:complete len:280 (-) Transcript_25276:87-926(-)
MLQVDYSSINNLEYLVKNLILILTTLLDSSKTSGSSGTNQTRFSTRWCVLCNSTGHTNVLVVSTTERVLNWILCHTTNLGPAISLHTVLVVCGTSLQQRLVSTSSTGHHTNLRTGTRWNRLLSSRRKLNTGGTFVFVVRFDNGEATRSTCIGTTVSLLGFNVTHDGTFGNFGEGKNVTNIQTSFLSSVNKLTSVHAFSSHEKFHVTFVVVRVEELNLCKGSSSTGVVDDFLHNTTDVTVALSVVQGTKLHGSLTGAYMRLKDSSLTFPLRLDVFTHGWI